MTHRSIKRRVLATTLATVLAPVFALGGAFVGMSGEARAAVGKADCQVHAVLFSKDGDGKVPKNLAFLEETLRDDAFAAYKGYHLIDKKTLRLQLDSAAKAAFKSGHKLGLTLRGGDASRLKLHANLTGRDGKGSLLDTEYSIEDNGLLMIAAGRHTSGEVEGKLFFAIQCARRQAD